MVENYNRYNDGLGSTSEPKFNIKACDVTVSNKTSTKTTKPSPTYIELTFNKDNEIAFFSYLTFQNFYTHMITIKQFIPPSAGANGREEMKNEKNWVSVLKNYQIMRNAHFENDAQNWHIIGVELVSEGKYCILTDFHIVQLEI